VETNKIDIAVQLDRFPIGTDVAPTRTLSPRPRVGARTSGRVLERHQFANDAPLFLIEWDASGLNGLPEVVRTWHYAEDLINAEEFAANARDYSGHEFEYDRDNDLFRCVHCARFERVLRDRYTQKIPLCAPSPVEAAGGADRG
jgi:hypothetical protein